MEPVEFGVLSLIPPVVAIVLAVTTKQVLVSLFAGIWLGATMLAGWNPIAGLLSAWRDFVIAEMAHRGNAAILVVMAILGGFAGLLERGGGAHVMAAFLQRRVRDSRSGQMATWVGGLAWWFNASGSPMMVGPMFRPITDRLRISREKLAYILDATASQVPVLIPITGWGVYIMSLIQEQYEAMGIAETPWDAFVGAVPWQFYAIGTLVMCGLVAATRWDFGSMRRAEVRAELEGKVSRDGAVLLREEAQVEIPQGAQVPLWNILAPYLVVLVTVAYVVPWTGGFPERSLLEAWARGAVVQALIMGFFFGSIIAGYLMVRSRLVTATQALDSWFRGAQSLFQAMIILVLAWSIGEVTIAVGVRPFIVGAAEGLVSPVIVPALIFLIGAGISFATGTSWGTYAVLMPLAIPLGAAVGACMYAVIGSVLSSGLFGDHSSPISDTTVLSSMASCCDHMDHVNTQIPYALTVAGASTAGYLVGASVGSAWLGLAVALGGMTLAVYVLARRAGGSMPVRKV